MSARIDVCAKVNEIVGYWATHKKDDFFQAAHQVGSQLIDLIKKIPLGGLSDDAMKCLDRAYFKKIRARNLSTIAFWETYKQWTHYCSAADQEKPGLFEQLVRDLLKIKRDILTDRSVLDKVFVRVIYESNCSELIDLFQSTFSAPPLSIFDVDKQPKALVEIDGERAKARAVFDARNASDPHAEQKAVCIQRYIRAKIRAKSEVDRIGERYYEDIDLAVQEAAARAMIKDANTPYIPRECSRELARRILRITGEIKLFTSVTHLLSAANIAQILDGCLYGRENLINSYIPFRNAALGSEDIQNGDGNVICLGPDKIDPICLQGRTVGLELDLDQLIFGEELDVQIYGEVLDELIYGDLLDELTSRASHRKNPTFFFKQEDLAFYTGEKQSIKIGDEGFVFSHTGHLSRPRLYHANLQMHDDSRVPAFYAEVEKDRLISYNIGRMHQILTLNFFRFLDVLKDGASRSKDGSSRMAVERTKQIYDAIEKLDDEKLEAFLKDLGKKMSCSSEFNITGAYKVNPSALCNLLIYEGEDQVDSIAMNDLCNQPNDGNFECLNRLEKHLPEILKSTRFVNFLLAKVKNQVALEKLREFTPIHQETGSEQQGSSISPFQQEAPSPQDNSQAGQVDLSQAIEDWDRIWNKKP